MGGRGQSFCNGALALALALSAAFATRAQERAPLPPGLSELDAGHVAEVIDGQTLRLADGRILRLAGIQAPQPPLTLDEDAVWRRAAEAQEALAGLAAGREVKLYGAGRALSADRHGRLLAQVTGDNGLWLQGALLSAGMGWVLTAPNGKDAAPALYAAEEIARAAGRGIWADPYYAVRCADDLNNATDATRVVQGRVLDVADINGALYLNFGADWRSDFTIRVERRDRRRLGWREAPNELEGTLVEVRGWVYWFNGPAIDLDHGARLRRLSEDSQLLDPACG